MHIREVEMLHAHTYRLYYYSYSYFSFSNFEFSVYLGMVMIRSSISKRVPHKVLWHS